jgi:hypothetical protein
LEVIDEDRNKRVNGSCLANKEKGKGEKRKWIVF